MKGICKNCGLLVDLTVGLDVSDKVVRVPSEEGVVSKLYTTTVAITVLKIKCPKCGYVHLAEKFDEKD